MSAFADFMIYLVVSFLWWFVLLPICMLLATPVIAIASFFGGGGYWEELKCRYRRVIDFWANHAWAISP